MADNYLGRKMEEYYARPREEQRRPAMNLRRLLARNRSHRNYDASFVVREDQMHSIIEVNTLIASACNRQALRFRPVLADEAGKVLPHIRLGAALPDEHLPKEGFEPNAFIVVCSDVAEDRYLNIDLGISAQSMSLRATELGLNGICIASFDREQIKCALNLSFEPLLILAVGRGADKIELVEVGASESRNYYRRGDTHCVPKVRVEDLIVGK